MTGKKHRRATYCVVSIVLLGLGCVGWFWLSELAVVKEAPYDVEVVDVPQLRGTVYTMGRRYLLLVLSTPEVSPRYAFVVDLSRKAMGVAYLPRYTRLGRSALVHSETLEGYCETCAGLTADFGTSGDSIAITVTGWFDRFVNPEKDGESSLKRSLIYQKRIVLKLRTNNT